MRAKDNPANPGIGSGPYGSNYDFRNEDTGMEFGLNGPARSSHKLKRIVKSTWHRAK